MPPDRNNNPPDKGGNARGAPPPQQQSRVFSRIDPAAWSLPSGTITDIARVRTVFQIAQEKGVNLLGPEYELDHIFAGHAVSLRMVLFDPWNPEPDGKTKSNGRWYRNKQGMMCLHHICLMQLAQIAGVNITSSVRVDDGRVPLLWRYACGGEVRLFDGTPRKDVVNYELDLRDGSAQLLEMHESQRRQARVAGARLAESKCRSALIRELLCVHQGYTDWEAERPFLWPSLVWAPDMSNPAVVEMIAARALGYTAEMYGAMRQGSAARGQVIDAVSVPVSEPKALPAPGAPPVDYAEENRKLQGQREKVPVRQEQEPQQRRAPIPDLPAERLACTKPGCSAEVTPDLARWCQEHLGALFCRPHAMEERNRRNEGGPR